MDFIGFQTSKGRTVGPWGVVGGTKFTVNGVVLGFFGDVYFDVLASIGAYTLAIARVLGPIEGAPLDSNVTLWNDGTGYEGIKRVEACVGNGPDGLFVAGIKVTYSGNVSFQRGQSCQSSIELANLEEGISSIDIYANNLISGVDSHISGIQTTFVDGTIAGHGTLVGNLSSISLAPGEVIINVTGYHGEYIFGLTFGTSGGKIHGPYGGSGGSAFTWPGPVFGFFGGEVRFFWQTIIKALGFWTLASLVPPSPPPQFPSPPEKPIPPSPQT
eukprot:jgi/Botrbrau1/14406/Bobra.0014s0053.1